MPNSLPELPPDKLIELLESQSRSFGRRYGTNWTVHYVLGGLGILFGALASLPSDSRLAAIPWGAFAAAATAAVTFVGCQHIARKNQFAHYKLDHALWKFKAGLITLEDLSNEYEQCWLISVEGKTDQAIRPAAWRPMQDQTIQSDRSEGYERQPNEESGEDLDRGEDAAQGHPASR